MTHYIDHLIYLKIKLDQELSKKPLDLIFIKELKEGIKIYSELVLETAENHNNNKVYN